MKISELLKDPKSWIQCASAKSKDNSSVSPTSSEADKWCLSGAVVRCYPIKDYEEISGKVREKVQGGILWWNDKPGRTHQEVLDLVTQLDI